MKNNTHHSASIFLNTQYVVLSIFAILTGGVLYITFRPSEHLFYTWIHDAGMSHWLNLARNVPLPDELVLPDWIVFSLPNGLWAFAYALIITGTWSGSKSWLKIPWMATIPLLVLGYEFLQRWEVIPGTFCNQDIVSGLAGILLGIFIGYKRSKSIHHEKVIE